MGLRYKGEEVSVDLWRAMAGLTSPSWTDGNGGVPVPKRDARGKETAATIDDEVSGCILHLEPARGVVERGNCDGDDKTAPLPVSMGSG